MNLNDIIREKLLSLGADGLYYSDKVWHCYCMLDNLMSCDMCSNTCVPGKLDKGVLVPMILEDK